MQALSGIGPESSARLLETFGSVEAIFSATVNDLMCVPGAWACKIR
ncbi:helix-hairpin-helix domain-containing protein [Methylocaldum sp.]